jgi:hypothetical protein
MGVNERNEHVMGFDHEKTKHRFLLHTDDGAIEVTANSADDAETCDQLRKLFGHIARMFAEGNFKAPMLIHVQTPPCVPVMQRLKGEIRYEYGETERGARVSIKTATRRRSPPSMTSCDSRLRITREATRPKSNRGAESHRPALLAASGLRA